MPTYSIAKEIVQRFVEKGFTSYFAGGWVRDHIMDHPSDDIDIVTSAPVETTQFLFEKTVPVGVNFGIVIVVQDGHQFEVATFRREEGYSDGRRPTKVEEAPPEEDAKRRDFTINGLFYNPLTEEIHDYVDGRADIEANIVRAIGDPHKRFAEDRLRMIRAVRYASRFHFTIEPETYAAIEAHASELFPSVAVERIYNEFEKMGKFPGFARAMITLHELGLLGVIFPNLKALTTTEIEHRVRLIPELPDNMPTLGKLLELFPSATLDEKLALCDKFKLANTDRDFVKYHDHAYKSLELPLEKLDRHDWVHLYAHPLFPICLHGAATRRLEENRDTFIQNHENQIQVLEPHILRVKQNDPLIRASHLIERGIAPGPQMGELLRKARRLAINEDLSEVTTVLHRLDDLHSTP